MGDLDFLIDDGSFHEKRFELDIKKEIKNKKKSVEYITEVERAILLCLKDTKNVRLISKMTGYPEVVITKAIERLIEKGYVDDQLNILVDINKRRKKLENKRSNKLLAIDIAIAIAVLVFIVALVYYFFS